MLNEEPPVIAKTISRYNVERIIRRVDTKTYIIEGESLFMRGTTDGTMADFEGGPYIEKDMPALDTGIPDKRNVLSVEFMDPGKDNYGKVKVRVG